MELVSFVFIWLQCDCLILVHCSPLCSALRTPETVDPNSGHSSILVDLFRWWFRVHLGPVTWCNTSNGEKCLFFLFCSEDSTFDSADADDHVDVDADHTCCCNNRLQIADFFRAATVDSPREATRCAHAHNYCICRVLRMCAFFFFDCLYVMRLRMWMWLRTSHENCSKTCVFVALLCFLSFSCLL